VERRTETMNGAADLLALVVSLNVKRRNLTPGQRALAAAEAWAGDGREGGKDARSKRDCAPLIIGKNSQR